MTKQEHQAVEQAQTAIEQGKNEKAMAILRTIANQDLDNPNSWLLMALAAPNQEEALAYLDKSVALKSSGQITAQVLLWIEEHLESVPKEAVRPVERKISRMIAWKRISRWLIPVFYLIFLTVAEILTTSIDPRWGMTLHGLALVALYFHAALSNNRERLFLLGLSLAPLIRLISLTLPVLPIPVTYWYAIVGLPLFLATYYMIQTNNLTRAQIGMTAKPWYVQLVIIPFGVILGYIEFLILKPAPLVEEFTFEAIFIPALILMIFTGFLEELIFRGVMQYFAIRHLGRWGIVYIGVVFAVLHIGYNSFLDFVFVLFVSIFFSYVVHETGSILGVTLAHGLTNIGLFLIFPFIVIFPAETTTVLALPTVVQTRAVQDDGLLSDLFEEIEVGTTPDPLRGLSGENGGLNSQKEMLSRPSSAGPHQPWSAWWRSRRTAELLQSGAALVGGEGNFARPVMGRRTMRYSPLRPWGAVQPARFFQRPVGNKNGMLTSSRLSEKVCKQIF